MAGRAVARRPKDRHALRRDRIAYAEWAGSRSPVMEWCPISMHASTTRRCWSSAMAASLPLASWAVGIVTGVTSRPPDRARAASCPEASFVHATDGLEIAPVSSMQSCAVRFRARPDRGASPPDHSHRPLAPRRRPLPRHVRRGRPRGGDNRRLAGRTHVLCFSWPRGVSTSPPARRSGAGTRRGRHAARAWAR